MENVLYKTIVSEIAIDWDYEDSEKSWDYEDGKEGWDHEDESKMKVRWWKLTS